MKKYLILILSIVVFACSEQKGFKIKVNIEGAEGKFLLEQRGTEAWIPIDTVDIVDGVAQLEGNVETPGDYYLSVFGQRTKVIVFVENTSMSISGKIDSIDNVKIVGSKTHDEYKAINDQINSITQEYMALYQQSQEAIKRKDTATAERLMDEVNVVYEKVGKLQDDFIINNPASYVTPFFLSNIQYSKEVEELDAMVSVLDSKLAEVPVVVNLKKRISKLKTVAVGQIAPDFTQNDANGVPITFSDVYTQSQLTLLDFWAAWCGPCRAENPNVVDVYNDYKDKGFSVFGVSLDRTKEDWLKAIEDDSLTWMHVSDLNFWQNSVAKLYAINSIPSSLLIDKNGKIVAKNKRGEELRTAVSELLE